MYEYPSGLKCATSPARVRAYEKVVPFATILMVVLGWVAIVKYIGHPESTWRIVTIPWICAAWLVLCALADSVVFIVWCKPDLLASHKSQQ